MPLRPATASADLEPLEGLRLGSSLGSGWHGPACKVEIHYTQLARSCCKPTQHVRARRDNTSKTRPSNPRRRHGIHGGRRQCESTLLLQRFSVFVDIQPCGFPFLPSAHARGENCGTLLKTRLMRRKPSRTVPRVYFSLCVPLSMHDYHCSHRSDNSSSPRK